MVDGVIDIPSRVARRRVKPVLSPRRSGSDGLSTPIRTFADSGPAWVMPAALVLALLIAGCEQQPVSAPETLEVTIADRTFDLELALTSDQRYQGLSDRESIPEDGGMLFAFPKQRRLSFVMRKCLVPIDIIFLDGTGRVVATHAMKVEPYDTPDHALKRYSSGYPAQFAIELRGGTLSQMALSRGDPIDLPLQRLKQWAR